MARDPAALKPSNDLEALDLDGIIAFAVDTNALISRDLVAGQYFVQVRHYNRASAGIVVFSN
jgi:hypothetical protein